MPTAPRAAVRPSGSVWSWIAAFLLALYFLGTSLYIASKRLFWFDEIYTVLVARLPDLATMWKALTEGADLLPIPYYVIVRLSETILGRGELAARVPSALGLVIGLIVTFDCTRRLTDGPHGLLAQALLTCSFLPFYGYEARPYGLLFMFSALLLWVWLHGGAGKRAALAFGAVMLAATMVHYYAMLCLAPFAAYDAFRLRRPSAKLIAGCAGVALALALLAPQIMTGHRLGSKSAWPPPSPWQLELVFSELFPAGAILLAMIVLLVVVVSPRTATAPSASDGERVAWLFLLIPFAGYFLATFAGSLLYTRYFIGALPGIAVACGCFVYRHLGGGRLIPCGIAAILAAYGIAHSATKARNPERIPSFGDHQANTKALIAWEGRLLQEGKTYTAVRWGNLVCVEAWYYSKHPERYVELTPESVAPFGVLPRYFPLPPVWKMEDIRRHAQETALVVGSPEALEEMKNAGFRVTVRTADPLEIFYLETE